MTQVHSVLGTVPHRRQTPSVSLAHAKQRISGLDSQAVKTNGWLKNSLADEMTKLKTQIDSAIDEMPRRFIRYAENGNAMSAPAVNAT